MKIASKYFRSFFNTYINEAGVKPTSNEAMIELRNKGLRMDCVTRGENLLGFLQIWISTRGCHPIHGVWCDEPILHFQ